MRSKNNQQEILLFTATTFSNRNCNEISAQKEIVLSSHREQLERACWSGMLPEMLPEIMALSAPGRELYMWQVLTRDSFLIVEMSEQRCPADQVFSIDPYLFMAVKASN